MTRWFRKRIVDVRTL